jgi:hypothetical protein
VWTWQGRPKASPSLIKHRAKVVLVAPEIFEPTSTPRHRLPRSASGTPPRRPARGSHSHEHQISGFRSAEEPAAGEPCGRRAGLTVDRFRGRRPFSLPVRSCQAEAASGTATSIWAQPPHLGAIVTSPRLALPFRPAAPAKFILRLRQPRGLARIPAEISEAGSVPLPPRPDDPGPAVVLDDRSRPLLGLSNPATEWQVLAGSGPSASEPGDANGCRFLDAIGIAAARDVGHSDCRR